MKRFGFLISRYLITTIGPYFMLSWLLLSVILFVQQAGRYADLFFNVNIPANLVWQLTIALVPNVIAFTCPMAMLVGTIIGLTKMQGDSELVAIRAAGVGPVQIAIPIVALGMLLSIFAFFINLEGVPFAATLVRNVALQTAIKKLESPLEPGAFNSEIAGYTVFVRGGDVETGRWKNIFIYNEDRANASLRLITSSDGRVDSSGPVSELVLENATVITLPSSAGSAKYVEENIGEVRLAIRTSRGELIDKLSKSELTPEELGLQQLSDYAAGKEGKERVEARILQNRRLILSISPLIFCLLGTVIVLRLNRGGRNFGIVLALAVLVGYYLLAFLGEQLARTGAVGVTFGSLIPIGGSILAIILFSRAGALGKFRRGPEAIVSAIRRIWSSKPGFRVRNPFVGIMSRLRDFDILRNLIQNFLLTLAFLSAIFVIFTAFELWKFAGTIDGGVWLLTKYLIYLIPFMYLQIAPSAAMVSTLATFVIKSRQNEVVTWTSAGQSVYRLLAPCFLLMLLIGCVNWLIQEYALPTANQLQDLTRTQIRSRGLAPDQSGRHWVATDGHIYSFILGKGPASDNDNEDQCASECVHDLLAFEISNKEAKLRSVYQAEAAIWEAGKIRLMGIVERNEIGQGKAVNTSVSHGTIDESRNPFTEIRRKPSHLDSAGLAEQIESAESEVERRSLSVALEKKRTTLFLPFVMALFTAPFSLSLSRKGKVATVGLAVGLWLLFTGSAGVFEQLGINSYLSPALAVWPPLVVFSLIGTYLLARVRT